MQKRREAFYVEGSGANPDLVRQGVRWLVETSVRHGAKTAILVVPIKDNLTDGSIAEAIGNDVAVALARGESVTLTPGVQLIAYSERTMRHEFLHGPVLAVYCTPDILTKIDSASRNQPMAIVSWLEDEGRVWINKHQAQPVGNERRAVAATPRMSNPVIEQALKSLTNRVNLSTGISHPRDHDAAVHMFRILKRNNQEIDFDELPGWLIAHNWRSTHADQIVQMGRDIYRGKGLHAGSNPWGAQQIRTWKSRAKEESLKSTATADDSGRK